MKPVPLFPLLAPALILSFVRPALAEPAAGPEEPLPVMFVPLAVDRAFSSQEELLRELLGQGMLESGRFTEAVVRETGTDRELMRCVGKVNDSNTAETCWVRLGQGQGAQLMVTGKIAGSRKSCSVMLKLTELETRVIRRKHVGLLTPCDPVSLAADFRKGALVLAGVEAALPLPGPEPTPAVPPPAAPGGPKIVSGEVTAAVGNLVVEVKPFGQVRLELTDPGGRQQVEASPYRNARAAVGTWQLVASGAGYETVRQRLSVGADETTPVLLELRRLGALEVTGTPAGAAVEVSGPEGFSHRGGLPWSASGLASGSYQVKVSRSGYQPWVRSSTVEPGGTARQVVALEKEAPAQPPAASPAPAGLTITSARFAAHGDGTITDSSTGLMWQQSDSFGELKRCVDWNGAQDYARSLALGGHRDWRLPTAPELLALYDGGKTLNPLYQSHTGSFWTTDACGDNCRLTIYVGDKAGTSPNNKDNCYTYGVRVVRSTR